MTGKERLQTVLRGGIPDCVPVAPDFSNMIPARLTGKPFWDLYLYKNPPAWEAYIDCAKHFDIDAVMDGYFPLAWPCDEVQGPDWEDCIVFENEERIVTRKSYSENGKRVWADTVNVYFVADPPTYGVTLENAGMPDVPTSWKPVEGVQAVDRSPEGLKKIKDKMGDQGLVGVALIHSCVIGVEKEVYEYFDNPAKYELLAETRVDQVEKRFACLQEMPVKPDFLCVGGSGTLMLQTVDMFREIAFPAVKRAIELADAAGIPTHIHSCGPEKELVKIMSEETNLSVIDPLEIPPMGDCDLATLKEQYGNKITLKGNLHTTEVMLHGSKDDVITASKKAIDDAAKGGRFILSTGDQCGRDTPDENLHAMVEVARTYGRYNEDGTIVGDG
jgi:uroporphyrinogen decarboxylase